MKISRIVTGALVGAVLTAPLIIDFWLGDVIAGLILAPFALFDWLARVLPGNVITLGIDAIVSSISSLQLGETSSTAKSIEQLMALALFLGAGAIVGALFFWFQGRMAAQGAVRNGIVVGAVFGLVVLLAIGSVNMPTTVSPLVNAVWVVGLLAVWGAVLGWIYRRLERAPEAEASLGQVDIVAGPAAEPSMARPVPVQSTVLNRRQFLIRVGSASAVITVVGAGLGAILSGQRLEPVAASLPTAVPPTPQGGLPNAMDTLVPAPGTRPEYTPLAEHYRIDINLRSPELEGESWRLPITGLVDNPLSLTIDEIRQNYEPLHAYVTMACISNPIAGDLIGTTYWTGVSLQDLLADAGLQEGAAYLIIRGADGFHETVALDLIQQDSRVMLCYAWDNQPLTVDHGFPLRIWIPDRYGMKQPKWITSIEVTDQYEEGYWVRRGWDEVAQMNTTSVIDTVAAEAIVEDGDRLLVPVGGIAHAGARGINRVEVKVDDGEWQAASLRTPLSDTTWVVWRYDWPFEEGNHRFAVRAVDGLDQPQLETARGARPSGATGIHSVNATLSSPADSEAAG